MPIYPKCHLEISAEHYERHLERCSTQHKHGSLPLVSTSGGAMGATPYDSNLAPPISYPWWKYGLVVYPPRKLTVRQKWLVVLWYLLVSGPSGTIILAVVQLLVHP